MKKTLFFLFFLFLIILINRYLIADTGIYFAYDYLKNKLDINNTSNQVSIKNLEIKNDYHKYAIKDIQGIKNNYGNLFLISLSNGNFMIPSPIFSPFEKIKIDFI